MSGVAVRGTEELGSSFAIARGGRHPGHVVLVHGKILVQDRVVARIQRTERVAQANRIAALDSRSLRP
ncbi:hypothetical protein WMF37_00910 [Sorangium sp. So ce291]|uniref:hypothetical protein n=1 Tax=Sorangium sp. So ce291 TaxID=3133294 RepID=UPI003F63F93F